MKGLVKFINESGVKAKEFSIYFSYENNSIGVHLYGNDTSSDETGFKTIDEAVKSIYKKDKKAHINIIPSEKFVQYMIK